MNKLLTVMMLACCGLLAGQEARAGVQVGGTRIVYPAGAKSVSIPVMNNGDDRPYLVIIDVTKQPEGGPAPFIASPPLFRLERGAENIIRITKTGESLPADRESLFWFSARGTPASDTPVGTVMKADYSNNLKAAVSAGVGVFVKLFYRPAGLPVRWEAGMAGLKVSRTPKGLHLSNPSPYYMSFVSLQVGGKRVLDQSSGWKNTTLAPFSSMDIPAGTLPSGTAVSWGVLNDYGSVQVFKGDLS